MPLSSGVELHVRNFLAKHEGNYSCTATNPLGQVTGSVHLVPVYDLGVSKKKHMMETKLLLKVLTRGHFSTQEA